MISSIRRRLQFSLRVFLIALTVGCIWLGFQANQAMHQRQVAAAVEAAGGGGYVVYKHHEIREGGVLSYDMTLGPPGPEWLRGIVGDHYFQVLTEVCLNDAPKVNDEWLLANAKHLRSLPELRLFVLSGSDDITRRGLEALGSLQRLQTLILAAPVSDSGLECLKDLTELRRLGIYGPNITDDGVIHLRAMQELEHLDLGEAAITDAGLEHLAALPNLEYLYLGSNRITDNGLQQLKGLRELQFLAIFGDQLTDSGLAELQESLPDCHMKLMKDWPPAVSSTRTGGRPARSITRRRIFGGTRLIGHGHRASQRFQRADKAATRLPGHCLEQRHVVELPA